MVTRVNDAPTTVDQSFNTFEDTALDETLSAFDVDADPVRFELMRGAENGTVQLEVSGAFHYVPNADFNGRDTFRFRVTDGSLSSSVITATVSMRAVNDAPVIQPAKVATLADTPILIQLQVSDVEGDEITNRVSVAPTHGSAEVLEPALGQVLYVPAAGYVGADQLRVRASDDSLLSAEATVDISVTARSGPVSAPGLNDPNFGPTGAGLFAISPDLASSYGRSAAASPTGGFFLYGDTVTGLRRRPTIIEVDSSGELVTT
jgi:hypothetical protein